MVANKNTPVKDPLIADPQKKETLISYVNKYRRTLSFIGGGALLVLVSFFGYRYYINALDEAAQKEIFHAIYHFEADSLELALAGDGVNYGFEEIMNEYSGTPAAELAAYYAGVCALRLGRYDTAIQYFDSFSPGDWLLQARAYSLAGDAYFEKTDYTKAAEYYDKAANYKPNKQFSPRYLQKAAMSLELQGKLASAHKRYEQLLADYPTVALAREAKKHVVRLADKEDLEPTQEEVDSVSSTSTSPSTKDLSGP